MIHSVDKTHVLVATMELIWSLFLNTLSFNFVPRPNKSLRLTRQNLICAGLFKAATLLFLQLLVCSESAFVQPISAEHTSCSNVVNSNPRWVSRGKDVESLSINVSKLTVGVKNSISRKTTFSPNHHLVEEKTCFPFIAAWYGLNLTTWSCLSAARN